MEIRQKVNELSREGCSLRAISRALSLSRNTVNAILSEPVNQPQVRIVGPTAEWTKEVQWSEMRKEIESGVPIKTVFEELLIAGVTYDAFRLAYKRRFGDSIPKTAQRLQHKPAEMAQIDYADGIEILNPETGELRKTQFFCGVLPFSSYTFGEFTWDQKLPSFLRSHENMWAYFGGVTDYTVTDNLKAAVTKAHRFDPIENRTYCDFAKHWDFVVLPARPRTPRDKAAVESAIGVIQRSFFAQVRNQVFNSLHELNRSLKEYLAGLNCRVMKDHNASRNQRFEQEKSRLRPLAKSPFVLTEYRTSKVHPDCEIQVQKCFYSVPYAYVGKEVRVCISDRMVEIFDPETLEKVAIHPRQTDPGKHSIEPCHYPSRAKQLKTFDMQAVHKRAREIGQHASQALEQILQVERPL